MTPPVAPNTTAAPVPLPRGLSKGVSGRTAGLICSPRNIRTISRVVSTTSTSGSPSAFRMVGSAASAFLAVQGMMDTTNSFLGSTFSWSAK